MANTLLIGKDLPDCLEVAEALSATGRSVFTACKAASDSLQFESEKIYGSTWNKASAVSTHSLLINAETRLDTLDEVIFYFDASYFCSHFELDKSEEVTPAVETMISSFLYMTNELLKRADQKKEKLTVAFLIKDYPSKAEAALSKAATSLPSSNIVGVAQNAFMALAENFAALVEERSYLSVLLAKCSPSNELYKNEKLITDWLAASLDTIKNLKNHQTAKQAISWNKAGSKVSGFNLFK